MIVSRRDFLKFSSGGALSLLALKYLPGSTKPIEQPYNWRSILNRSGIHWSSVIEEIDEKRIPPYEREEYEVALQNLVNLQGGPTGP